MIPAVPFTVRFGIQGTDLNADRCRFLLNRAVIVREEGNAGGERRCRTVECAIDSKPFESIDTCLMQIVQRLLWSDTKLPTQSAIDSLRSAGAQEFYVVIELKERSSRCSIQRGTLQLIAQLPAHIELRVMPDAGPQAV